MKHYFLKGGWSIWRRKIQVADTGRARPSLCYRPDEDPHGTRLGAGDEVRGRHQEDRQVVPRAPRLVDGHHQRRLPDLLRAHVRQARHPRVRQDLTAGPCVSPKLLEHRKKPVEWTDMSIQPAFLIQNLFIEFYFIRRIIGHNVELTHKRFFIGSTF